VNPQCRQRRDQKQGREENGSCDEWIDVHSVHLPVLGSAHGWRLTADLLAEAHVINDVEMSLCRADSLGILFYYSADAGDTDTNENWCLRITSI
jgi:hypothetical protein